MTKQILILKGTTFQGTKHSTDTLIEVSEILADEMLAQGVAVLPASDIYDDNDARRHAGQKPLNEMDELDLLVLEYTEWQKAQGLELGSADDHWFDENLTDAQRAWLRDFSERWDDASPVLSGGVFVAGRDVR